MSGNLFEILIVLLLIVANGLFSMSEIALISARRIRLQQRAEDGDNRASIVLNLIDSPNRFLSTVQVGITLIGILAGAVGGAALAEELAPIFQKIPVLAPIAQGLAFTLVVLVITYLSLVIGELIPKRIAMNNPEAVALSAARPMRVLSWLAAPLVTLLDVSTEFGVRLLRLRPSDEPPVTEDEIKGLMEQGTEVGIFEEVEQDMIESVFRLGDRRVESIMTPRTEIVWLDLAQPYEKNLQTIIECQHSQFPVGEGSLDNVIGVLRAKDLLNSLVGKDQLADLRALSQAALFVPESMPAFKVLENLRTSSNHMAMVIDEYGGLQGMVTLFDILEAIVGDIQRQGRTNGDQITRREDGSWLIDGLLPIDELKEILDVENLPAEERVGFRTVGGFVMAQMGTIPTPGQSFEWDGWRFEVMDMDGRRVDKMMLSKSNPEIHLDDPDHPNSAAPSVREVS